MKIRTDFVTNSSSSSFILGCPTEANLTIENAKRYLAVAKSKLHLDSDIKCEFIIDLKYDSTKKYTIPEVQFVVEAIVWYLEFGEGEKIEDYIIDEDDIICVHDENGNRVRLYEYTDKFTKAEIKAIFNYAHRHFGEILVGNCEEGFKPDEFYYDIVAKSDDIVYKCNHMG